MLSSERSNVDHVCRLINYFYSMFSTLIHYFTTNLKLIIIQHNEAHDEEPKPQVKIAPIKYSNEEIELHEMKAKLSQLERKLDKKRGQLHDAHDQIRRLDTRLAKAETRLDDREKIMYEKIEKTKKKLGDRYFYF